MLMDATLDGACESVILTANRRRAMNERLKQAGEWI